MNKARLIEMAQDGIAHAEANSIAMADDVLKVPASNYYDAQRWQQEMELVFRRLPLLLATSVELPNAGDYKAIQAGNTPVFIIRDEQGEIRAFVNSCAHRGSQLLDEGRGQARRITCPYHAWSYNHRGELTNIYKPQDFGDIDKSCYGLVQLKTFERSGLIWVLTDPESELDIETYLVGYDEQLAHFGFEDWYYFDSRRVDGPNWKIAYDGYLDFYHLPILHKDTFGADTSPSALYYNWGPHQHVKSPQTTLAHLADIEESEWPTAFLLSGVWTVFPHVSIASFGEEGDSRGVLISQLFPGETPGTSYTIQNYLLKNTPDEEGREEAEKQFELLKYVVAEEDYATGLKQQRALETGTRDHVLFGRNEEGGQRFHRWLQTIMDTEDKDLNQLFANPPEL